MPQECEEERDAKDRKARTARGHGSDDVIVSRHSQSSFGSSPVDSLCAWVECVCARVCVRHLCTSGARSNGWH
eukprot:9567772-Alexandrium_andersonii.AAC.1